MAVKDEPEKFCIEFVEFPGAEMPWLIEKAAAIDSEMAERLSGAFRWHSVVPCPELRGFKVYFQIDPEAERPNDDVAETLVAIIREIASNDLPGCITGDTLGQCPRSASGN